jgi:hypothetical protein
MSESSAKIIQMYYRKYKCIQQTKNIQELHKYFVSESKTNTFDDFKKIILKKSIQTIFMNFCATYNNYKKGVEIKYRIILTLYFIYLYPNDILFNAIHPYDRMLQDAANDLVKHIYTEPININNIWDGLQHFNLTFVQWAKMDKDRLIEDCIKSYYFKCEHIDKILEDKSQKSDNEQKLDMINELENQKKDLVSNILSLDNTFDTKFFEENYKLIYNNIILIKEKLHNSISINMKLAYYNMVSEDLKNGTLLSALDMLKEIGRRLILICPTHTKEKFSEKFIDNNLITLLFDCAFTPEIIKFIYFLFDFIRLLDAPSNDESNNNYRSTIETQTKQEFHIYFPKILLHIEEKIDEIYNLIIHTNSVNK